jgi:hypothetical protein
MGMETRVRPYEYYGEFGKGGSLPRKRDMGAGISTLATRAELISLLVRLLDHSTFKHYIIRRSTGGV